VIDLVAIFAHLTEDERKTLAAKMRIKHYDEGEAPPRLDLRSRGKLRCRPSSRRSGNHRVRSPGRGCCKVCYVGLHRCIHFRCRRNTTGVLSTGFMTSTSVRTGLRAGERWIRTSGSAPAATPLTDRGVKSQATAAGCHFGEILPQGATLMMALSVSFSRNWRER
jgi:hypothetical protein